jgi:hypothetical protein
MITELKSIPDIMNPMPGEATGSETPANARRRWME